MGRALVVFGVVLIALGLAWPWLARLGLGKLPGDIVIERGEFRFYLPVTSSVVVSLLVSLLLWLLRR